jgi:Replicative DNA helicase
MSLDQSIISLYREYFLWPNTWYSLQTSHGDYISQLDDHNRPLILTDDQLKKHIEGQDTIAVQPIDSLTQKVKFGGFDFDAGQEMDPKQLQALLPMVNAVIEKAEEHNIVMKPAFSGRRGIHIYTFPETPIPASVMRKALKAIAVDLNLPSVEIFPFADKVSSRLKDDGFYQNFFPKGIKLVGGKHHLGTLSGFIDSKHWIWTNNLPELLPLEKTLQNLVRSPIDGFYQLAFSSNLLSSNTIKSTNGAVDWSLITEEHPSCISTLLKSGAPHSLEYNKANMTIARYTIGRNFSQAQGLSFANTMAKHSSSHPTSKSSSQDKLRNYKSVYGSMINNPPEQGWQCSYIWANTELRKSCLSCPIATLTSGLTPRPLLEFNIADELAEAEIIHYILDHPDALDTAFNQSVMGDCFLTTRSDDGRSVPVTERIFTAMEDAAEGELRVSTLLTYIDPEDVAIVSSYLTEIMLSPCCSQETFFKHLLRVQDNGTRMEAIGMAYDSVETFMDRSKPFDASLELLTGKANKLVSKHSKGSIKPMSHFLSEMVGEMLDDAPQAIPTPSDWLNEILLGGWRTRRMMVLAAPPGAGKTTFLNACADYATKLGFPVIEAQFEMDKEQLFYYSLARISGINSRLIEGRRWLDSNYPEKDALVSKMAEAVRFHAREIAPRIFISEADETVFPATIRRYIREVRSELELPQRFPVLVLIDYLQLMLSGVQSLDESTNETLRVSRVASALKRVARSEHASIVAISDITKEAFKKALESGRLDMGALRDSFKVAHTADSVGILMAGKVPVKIPNTKDSKAKDITVHMDQIEFLAHRYSYNPDLSKSLLDLRKKYPLNPSCHAKYACLEFVKNRGSLLGTPLFVYEKAYHRYIPVEIKGTLWEVLTSDE